MASTAVIRTEIHISLEILLEIHRRENPRIWTLDRTDDQERPVRMERSFAEAGTIRKSCLSSRLNDWPNQCFYVRLIIEKRNHSSNAYECSSWRSDRSLKDGAWASGRSTNIELFRLRTVMFLDHSGLPAVIFAPCPPLSDSIGDKPDNDENESFRQETKRLTGIIVLILSNREWTFEIRSAPTLSES